MKVFKGIAEIKNEYIFESGYNINDIIFFDIETTGLSRDRCRIYLIGALYFENDTPYCIQWLSDKADDEKELLFAFASFAIGYRTVVHFNGNAFDIPFVCERCKKHNIKFNFEKFDTVDLYKKIYPYKHIFKLENFKQKSLEKLIGIERQDIFSGGDLIHVYREYLLSNDDRLMKTLLLHNYEDVIYMVSLTALEAYHQLFEDRKYTVTSAEINEYKSVNDETCRELIITLRLYSGLPAALSHVVNGFYITGSGRNIKLRSAITDNEAKLYHKDYKEYFYLPAEDIAIHKSVAQFVDKNFRKKAAAANCFTKIKITDEITENAEFINKYADSVLDAIICIK